MKRVLHFTIFILYFTFFCNAQNLVPNPSFEDTLSCPTDQDQLYKVKPWFRPTMGTPDYFNQCYHSTSPTPMGIPLNFFGHQYARTGNAYAGEYVVYNKKYQFINMEYIETRLIDSLKPGNKYFVTFYVSLGDTCNLATNRMGAYLSKDSLYNYSTLSTLNVTPQIENPVDSVIADKINWIKISGTYIARGGEKFIAIGDFYDYSSNTVDSLSSGIGGMYYYIDDVSVTLDTTTGINESEVQALKFDVYPNPTSEKITIRISDPGKYKLQLFNTLGEEVFSEQKIISSARAEIDISQLPPGIYIVQLSNSTALGRSKIIVEKK